MYIAMIRICTICQKNYKRRGKRGMTSIFCSYACRNFSYVGKKISEETREKLKGKRAGSKAWNWKGDNVGKCGLHSWIRKQIKKPEFCEICKKNVPIDLASKNHVYKRDFSTWLWLCRSCHRKMDGHQPPKGSQIKGGNATKEKWNKRSEEEKKISYEKKKKYQREWARKKKIQQNNSH